MIMDSKFSIKLVHFGLLWLIKGSQIVPLGAIIWHGHEAKSLLIPTSLFIEAETTLALRT